MMTKRNKRATHAAEMTARSEYFTLATLLANIPPLASRDVDAVVVRLGIERSDYALYTGAQVWSSAYNMGGNKSLLLVEGYHNEEEAIGLYSQGALAEFISGAFNPPLACMYTQVYARHAGEQSKWTAEMIRQHNLKRIVYCVPSFHVLRAVLGLLAELQKLRLYDVLVVPKCPFIDPFEVTMFNHETGKVDLTMMDVIDGEIDGGEKPRIPAYQESGDNLATAKFITYLRTVVYEHPNIRSQLTPSF